MKRKGEVGKPRQRGENKIDGVRNRGSRPLLGRILGKGTYRMGWKFTYYVLFIRSHYFYNFSIELTRRATALGS